MQLNNDSQHTIRGYMMIVAAVCVWQAGMPKCFLQVFTRHLDIVVEQPLHVGYGRVFQSFSVGKGDLERFLSSYIMTVDIV